MDEEEASAVVERNVRAVLELDDDEPIPPGSFALVIERARERERRFAEQVRERQAEVATAWEQVVHGAQRERGGSLDRRPEVVWRDPASPAAGAVDRRARDSRASGAGQAEGVPTGKEPAQLSPALSSPYGPFATHPTHLTHATHGCDAGQTG